MPSHACTHSPTHASPESSFGEALGEEKEDCTTINSHPSTAPDSSKDFQTLAGSGGENRTRETLKANGFITTFFGAEGSCVEKRVNSEESSLVKSWWSWISLRHGSGGGKAEKGMGLFGKG